MGMNCKPGDLAIVIRAGQTPQMLGRIVTVVRLAVRGERFKTDRGHMWWMEHSAKVWVVRSNYPMPWCGDNGTLHFTLERVFHDDGLRPINPGVLAEDEDQVNKLKEPA